MAYSTIAISESITQQEYSDIEAGESSGVTISSGIKVNAGVTIGKISGNLPHGNRITDNYGYSLITKPSELEV